MGKAYKLSLTRITVCWLFHLIRDIQEFDTETAEGRHIIHLPINRGTNCKFIQSMQCPLKLIELDSFDALSLLRLCQNSQNKLWFLQCM